jgi:hypothetical protein
MKRVVTMILLLAVLSGLLGGCGLGENPDFRFKLNKDRKSYTLVEYVGDDEDVEIPKTHRDKPVTAIDGFTDNKNIETVEIPRGVQRIESHAFKGCSNLESVDFPKTLSYIGDYAFRDCESLEEVVIPKVKKTRWGLGIHAGYGLQFGQQIQACPYVGVGVSYDLLSW